jgi:hypothetical protein
VASLWGQTLYDEVEFFKGDLHILLTPVASRAGRLPRVTIDQEDPCH